LSEAGTKSMGEQVTQQELPIALVAGQPYTQVPVDLYIPPDALEVILEAFEGPLDLLLYLIRRQNLDILNIPIAEITTQYVEYISLMNALNFELAAEYLVMAAMLAEIKSRLLLPRQPAEEDEEADPRAELVRRLQEYERFKQAAEDIDRLERRERDFAVCRALVEHKLRDYTPPSVDIQELLAAFKDVLERADLRVSHEIEREVMSVRDRMIRVLDTVSSRDFVPFQALFDAEEGKAGAVVSFLAILELLKQKMLDLVQKAPYGNIYVRGVRETAGSEPRETLNSDFD